MKTAIKLLALAATAFLANAAFAHHVAPARRTNASTANWSPDRTRPVKTGEFRVDLIVVAFPDCKKPADLAAVKKAVTTIGSSGDFAAADMVVAPSGDDGRFTVTDYYKAYSQGIAWPVFAMYPVVYTAPEPLGYYCRFDPVSNPIGYRDGGHARARKLREDALRHAKAKGRLPPGGSFNCWIYCKELDWDSGPSQGAEGCVRKYYPKPTPREEELGARDRIRDYKPAIRWADPLWPNSTIQIHYPGGGGVMVHELGHCLGAPDFYHASEEHDGLPGSPALNWAYGPTGPAYCRWKYMAFVPPAAYPVAKTSGRYVLAPRTGTYPFRVAGGGRQPLPLGLFVPSTHPNYMIYLEYCRDEKPPAGRRGDEGLLVHAINVTMTSPLHGPPDLCYTYRRGDKSLKAVGGGDPFLRAGDSWTADTDPAAMLPNRLPAGVAITNIVENADGSCTVDIVVNPPKLAKRELDFSLLPQTRLVALDGALPTSFRAELDVVYRGEPLKSEYGFCIGTRKDPVVSRDRVFPLHHRDRYEARIIDLEPGGKYHVRGYAKNANGVRYSENQMTIVLPQAGVFSDRETPGLFLKSDRLLNTWHVRRYYFGAKNGFYRNANAIISLLALANYYRAVPGEATRQTGAARSVSPGRAGNGAIDMEDVHCNPSDTRPKFRMASTEKLISRMTALARASGLMMNEFVPDDDDDDEYLPGGKNGGKKKKKKKPSRPASAYGRKSPYGEYDQWVKLCAGALKIRKPEEVFFKCGTEGELKALAPKIKEWILLSQPVMIVRESKHMGIETENRHPLDIVFIDGFDGDRFHAVFPLGHDRSERSRKSSFLELSEFLADTTGAIAMFYRPGGVPRRQPKMSSGTGRR